MTKRQIRKRAKQRRKAREETKIHLYWTINGHILDAITGWIWSIGKKKFNALLIGKDELSLLKEMKHVYNAGLMRSDVPKFISYLCPKKNIQIIPVEAENYIKIANVVLYE